MALFRSVCAASLLLALAACNKKDGDGDLAALDAQLTNNAADPAMKGALNDPILVDPQLVGQANRDAVRQAGGKLLSAPAPTTGEAMASTVTLGAVAREQAAAKGGNANCTKKLKYGMEWAQRLPEGFPLYPGAQLMEAAGAQTDGCTLRAASFVTAVPRQGVMDYYYTLARRAGYDGEHKIMGGDHVLGGTRASDGAAYFILFTDAPGGRTSVDIIADQGR